MSIAWSTLAGLVLLAPGFAALLGYYIPRKASRDVSPHRALSTLATLVGVSLVVHILSVSFYNWLSTKGYPTGVDLVTIARIATIGTTNSIPELASAISDSLLRFLGYFGSTGLTGGLMGYFFGKLVVSGPLRSIALHGWAYQLSENVGFTYAYVLSNVRHENLSVMYRGVLHDFHISPTGHISYLVLVNPSRYFLILDGECPRTTAPKDRLRIGATSEDFSDDDEFQYLMIEGEDIANVVFHRFHGELDNSIITDKSFEELRAKFAKIMEEIEKTSRNDAETAAKH